jgi:hypothetical protein
MGIKMQKVRHHGKELKINEYDVNIEYGQLKCFYCDADVSFVNSYERNLGERKITVHRFFRLKGGQEHRNGCKYTVDGAVLDIYAACADDELMSKQDNKFVVRLLLASDDIEGKSSNNINDVSGHGKRKHNYIPKGKKTAYLSTIHKIMQLRTMVENNADLEEKINLQFYDWKNKAYLVQWKKFYFDSEKEYDYEKLLKYLIGGQVYHPICIDGYIKSVEEYQKDKYCLKLEPVLKEDGERVAISIYFHNEQIYRYLAGKENSRIVVYTKFNFYRKNEWDSPDKQKFIYYNITGNIYDKKQTLLVIKV